MLTLCTVCSRHARADEACCPFCGGTLSVPKRERKINRSGRAAILFGATLAAASCGGSQSDQSTTVEDDEDTVVEDQTPPPDEGSGGDDGSADSGDGSDDIGSPVALYGVPAPD